MNSTIYILSDIHLTLNASLKDKFSVKKALGIVQKEAVKEILETAIKEEGIIFYGFKRSNFENLTKELLANEDILSFNFFEFGLNNLTNLFEGASFSKVSDYFTKIEAMEFSLEADDRNDWSKLEEADIILVGVSCTAKTPLSLYLGYQGYKVANLPLMPEVNLDLVRLLEYKDKIVGLTISKRELSEIRQERLKRLGLSLGSTYASINRINRELEYATEMFQALGCPILDVTEQNIEALSFKIINSLI